MADDTDSKKKKKDLTALIDLQKLDEMDFPETDLPDGPEFDLMPPEDLADPFAPAPLPTGEETAHGEEPAGYQTGVDSQVFDGLPPIDPEIQALASGSSESEEDASGTPDDEPYPELKSNPEPKLEFDNPASADFMPHPDFPAEETDVVAEAPKTALASPTTATRTSMDAVREYSDSVTPEHSAPATTTTPFSLLIEGPLLVHEKERLLQILAQEKIGIREVDLEPQFEAGRILIPRISEYAGVILVQALRNSRAMLKLAASDRIFKASDTTAAGPVAQNVQFVDDRRSTIFAMPVTSDQTFVEAKSLEVIDTLHGSTLIQASQVLNSRSSVVQESIEMLKTQMKLQAHFRGANGIVNFKTELQQHAEHSHYTLIVQGVAVRTQS